MLNKKSTEMLHDDMKQMAKT